MTTMAASNFDMGDLAGLGILFGLLAFAWYVITIIQAFLSYGTAYRLTKKGGDNGLALFGWMLVMGWASAVPGLGFYLWKKYKNETPPYNAYGAPPYGGQPYNPYGGQPNTSQPQPYTNPYGGQPTDPNSYYNPSNNPYDGPSNNNPPV